MILQPLYKELVEFEKATGYDVDVAERDNNDFARRTADEEDDYGEEEYEDEEALDDVAPKHSRGGAVKPHVHDENCDHDEDELFDDEYEQKEPRHRGGKAPTPARGGAYS